MDIKSFTKLKGCKVKIYSTKEGLFKEGIIKSKEGRFVILENKERKIIINLDNIFSIDEQ